MEREPAADATSAISDDARTLYDELVRTRDRLAGLPPVGLNDVESVLQAQHELFWYLVTPPAAVQTDLPLPEATKRKLLTATRDRNADLHTTVLALLAIKLSDWRKRGASDVVQLQELEGLLDALTFDYRRSKRTTLALLRGLKSDIDARIAYVTKSKTDGYRFTERPVLYHTRSDKAETPLTFFERVYAGHVRRGLTQADLRRIDPAFYNVLHVWCARHGHRMSNLLPSTRPRRPR